MKRAALGGTAPLFDEMVPDPRLERALLALDGLSVGDALGERFFERPAEAVRRIEARQLPERPWRYTDDTEMALAITETLAHHGRIHPGVLAVGFCDRYRRDPQRGYGAGAHDVLGRIGRGEPWQVVAASAFDGQGSRGNGAAMRAAPVGAFFADDADRVVEEARASAAVTHAHRDGQAGAIAVALAAAWACWRASGRRLSEGLLAFVAARTPAGPTREGLERAAALWARGGDVTVHGAARELGNGSEVLSSDTVPFALWSAAKHLESFEETFWATVSALGDRDTTCAIACGVVALAVGREGIPPAWLAQREPLALTLPSSAAT